MRFDLYLFDLDGTLIDSGKDIALATNYTLKKLGFSELPTDEILKHVGYGGKKLLEGVLGLDNKELINEAVNIFREFYFNNPVIHTKPYPYVEDVLYRLKEANKKIAVVTNKYENVSRSILEKLKLDKYIDVVVGGDTLSEKKPSPEPIKYVLKTLDQKEESSIMIGDSETDILSGKNAHVKTGLVMFGYGKKELAKSYKPDYILKDLRELLTL